MNISELTRNLARDLEEAQRDLELFIRLSTAEARVVQLGGEYAKAKAADDVAEAAKAEAIKAARFDGLSDIQVTRTGPRDENLVRSTFSVSWSFTGDDGRGEPVTKRTTVQGFRALDPLPFAFLIEKHPERIPAEIMALAPGDPYGAFDAYFVALQRGYIVSAKAVA